LERSNHTGVSPRHGEYFGNPNQKQQQPVNERNNYVITQGTEPSTFKEGSDTQQPQPDWEPRIKINKKLNTITIKQALPLPNYSKTLNVVLSNMDTDESKLIIIDIKINGIQKKAMIDTGAELSVIAKGIEDVNAKLEKYNGPTTTAADDKRIRPLGQTSVDITLNDGCRSIEITTNAMVLNNLPCQVDFLIGNDISILADLQILVKDRKIHIASIPEEESEEIPPFKENEGEKYLLSISKEDNGPIDILELDVGTILTQTRRNSFQALINRHRMAFAFKDDELKTTDLYTHKIDTADESPIHSSPYRQSHMMREKANEIIVNLLNCGFIRPSFSPCASPVVMVGKKDTTDLRFCVDYRKLNAKTKRYVYPIQDISLSIDALSRAKIFSTLDLRSGYYQIKVNEEDIPKTAFITTDGLWEFVRMPFGLVNAPATFCRTMNTAFAGLRYSKVIVYLDDVVVFSKDIEKHFEDLQIVFKRLIDNNLKLKPTKCHFFQTRIKYVGFILDQSGLRSDPEKVAAIQNAPQPETVTEIRAFVGFCSYYRKLVRDFSKIAEPLTRLTKSNVRFSWDEEQDTASKLLKKTLLSDQVLIHYDLTQPTQLRTDASDVGLGAILLQKNQEIFRPVAYASRLLKGAEVNYGISDRECLAIIFGIEKFRQYLEGIYFEIYTDNCALCFLKSKAKLPPRLMRYSLLLQEFNFDIFYKSGNSHRDVDCLSRFPIDTSTDIKSNIESKLMTIQIKPDKEEDEMI